MKKLIHFLAVVFCFASLLSLAVFSWNYRQHYGDWGTSGDISKILKDYNLSSLEEGQNLRIKSPDLPDISPYTVSAIRKKIPDIKQGSVYAENLETGYRKMRGSLAFFGEKQNRLDPLSIVISEGVYDLEEILKEINDPSLINKSDNGVYTLHVPLSIRPNASLVINRDDVLLLSVNTGALISNFGDVFIYKAEVKGWNTEKDEPAFFDSMDEFRPHITTWCGSKLYIAESEISHLGYQASKSYGVSYTSCTDTLYRDTYAHLPGGTGWIVDSKFYDIYFGFYSYEANDVAIVRNEYHDNIVYAIDPHDRSRNLIIAENLTRGAKQKHGIIVSREVADSYIFRNIAEENNGSGIMIDRNSHNNIVAYNISRNNKQDGLTFYESPNNISYKNTLVGNNGSGMRIRNSWNIISEKDVINYNGTGVQLYSLYLTPERGATYRDLDLDPYVQKAGGSIVDAEIVGNKKTDFMLEDFDDFKIVNPRLYKSPRYIFSGDLKHSDAFVNDYLHDAEGGLYISSKKASDQNLIRSSVDPR